MKMTSMVTVVFAVVLSCGVSTGETISGGILQISGEPIQQLRNFQVVAQVGGRVVGRGGLSTNAPPFRYSITVNDNAINRQDVRVDLVFSALGRQTTIVNGVAGNKAQNDLDVVMPIDEDDSANQKKPVVKTCNPCNVYYGCRWYRRCRCW